MKTSGYVPKRWLGAFKAGHHHSAKEFIDETLSWELLNRIISSNYTDQKAMDQLDYITKFNNEFHKCVIKKNDNSALHSEIESKQLKTDVYGNLTLDKDGNPIVLKLRETLYSRKNSLNRDIMTKTRIELSLDYFEPNPQSYEDDLIDFIDNKYNS